MGNWAQRQRRGAAVVETTLPPFAGEFQVDSSQYEDLTFELVTPHIPGGFWQVRARVISNGTWADSSVYTEDATVELIEIPGYEVGEPCEAEARLNIADGTPTTLYGGRITFTMVAE